MGIEWREGGGGLLLSKVFIRRDGDGRTSNSPYADVGDEYDPCGGDGFVGRGDEIWDV